MGNGVADPYGNGDTGRAAWVVSGAISDGQILATSEIQAYETGNFNHVPTACPVNGSSIRRLCDRDLFWQRRSRRFALAGPIGAGVGGAGGAIMTPMMTR
jgi:hypothetical protein